MIKKASIGATEIYFECRVTQSASAGSSLFIIRSAPETTMYRVCPSIITIALLCLVTCSLFAQADSVAVQLARTEREFSRTAGMKGIKSAFLAYLDDQSTVFYPRPVNGREAISADPETPGSLVWWPSVVEVASSGDLGFTTGPSEYRSGDSTDKAVHYGHFVSVWRKNREGSWKVLLDIGTGYPEQERKNEIVRFRQLHPRAKDLPAEKNIGRSGLLASDTAFSNLGMELSSDSALMNFGAEGVRVYRPGAFPAEGKRNVRALLGEEKIFRFIFNDGQVSSAGDFGFTYGIAINATSDTSNYVRIWRKEDRWKVLVDVMKPWKPRK